LEIADNYELQDKPSHPRCLSQSSEWWPCVFSPHLHIVLPVAPSDWGGLRRDAGNPHATTGERVRKGGREGGREGGRKGGREGGGRRGGEEEGRKGGGRKEGRGGRGKGRSEGDTYSTINWLKC